MKPLALRLMALSLECVGYAAALIGLLVVMVLGAPFAGVAHYCRKAADRIAP